MSRPATACSRFTWDDYRSWSDDERWELIDGQPVAMSPSPGFRHQDACAALISEFRTFLL
jgi:Uma2 family endonuclease